MKSEVILVRSYRGVSFKKAFGLSLALLVLGSGIWQCSQKPPLDPNQASDQSFKLLVGVQSLPEAVPPGGNALIEALVLDQDSNPSAGDTVTFSTNSGTVSPTISTTNDSGIATTMFTAPQQTGSATIIAEYNSGSQSVTVPIQDRTPDSGNLVADQNSLLANGLSFTRIESVWRTQDGTLLKGVPVTFETSLGTITSPVTTDSFGVAETELVSAAVRQDAVAEVTGRAESLESTTQVLFRGVQFTMTASPQTIIADGRSTSNIRILLKEATSTVAISGAGLTFGTDLGTIPNTGTTNSSGVEEVSLTSESQTGIATVTAVYGATLTETVQVNMSQSLPTYLNLSANPSVIRADNQSTASIKAVVSDQNNNPVSDGTEVNFEIIDGSGTIESNKETENGVAISTLTSSTQPDTVTIVARVDQLTDTTSVRYTVGEAATLTVTADSTSLPADGTTSTRVVANVFDEAGNPVSDGTLVTFSTDIGDLTPNAQTVAGQAVAQFSSSVTGTATITASVGGVSAVVTVKLLPGPPNSVLLTYDPNTMGVKDSGRNQTVTVTATVLDSKNNPVIDGTPVSFSIFSGPGGGEQLSSTEPIPTLNGQSQVALNSGIRSGSVRIQAQVTDTTGAPIVPAVRAISTEIIILGGPPFIEDVNDRRTSHLTVGATPINIRGWDVVNNTATVVVVVGDKFNNPVPPGTAVYFTTTGGVISTHTGFTDEDGVASVTIRSGQPDPDITRYYNTFFDPNAGHPDFSLPSATIPGPIPDFEGSQVLNSVGNLGENDGIARILAFTEGVDPNGSSARAWSVTNVVFSGGIDVFNIEASDTELSPGESAIITIDIYDVNGNPIVAGSEISLQASAGELAWTSLTTDDPGVTRYVVSLTNNIDPNDPEAQEESTSVTVTVTSENGNVINSSPTINLRLN